LLSTISTSPCMRVEIGLVVGFSRTSVMACALRCCLASR
jgi:hypothetical protein